MRKQSYLGGLNSALAYFEGNFLKLEVDPNLVRKCCFSDVMSKRYRHLSLF
jgi:hypothetical protein